MYFDKNDKNFKTRGKEARRKQELNFYLQDLRKAGKKKKKEKTYKIGFYEGG